MRPTIQRKRGRAHECPPPGHNLGAPGRNAWLERCSPSSPHPCRSRTYREDQTPITNAPTTNEPRINDRIRAREVRLVDQDGRQLGIKPLPEALLIAQQQDL